MYQSRVISCGSYLPKKCVSNKDLEKIMDTTDEWIVSRSGIEQRYIANDQETTAFMATKACQQALDKANLKPADIDMIILATTTPDHPFPATATRVQAGLNAVNAFAFDVQAVCSGFIYALSVADNFIKTGQIKRALVIGADRMSNLLDWRDRSSAVLFGDGAGAYILESAPQDCQKGILSTHLFSDGNHYDALYVDIDSPFDNKRGYIKMEGRTVFKHAIKKMSDSICKALEANKLTIDDIDLFVPHQANKRIIEGIASYLHLPIEKVLVTIDKHSNTSAATIPLATCVGFDSGQIKQNDLILLTALGGGFAWGSAVIRFG